MTRTQHALLPGKTRRTDYTVIIDEAAGSRTTSARNNIRKLHRSVTYKLNFYIMSCLIISKFLNLIISKLWAGHLLSLSHYELRLVTFKAIEITRYVPHRGGTSYRYYMEGKSWVQKIIQIEMFSSQDTPETVKRVCSETPFITKYCSWDQNPGRWRHNYFSGPLVIMSWDNVN